MHVPVPKPSPASLHPPARPRLARLFWFPVLLPLLLLPACRTVPPPGPVDLSRPGWTVFEGQAIWQPAPSASRVAGDLLLATHRDGSALVQFSKSPFPLVSGQVTPQAWSVEFPTVSRRQTGRGSPPPRLLWLQLPAAYLGHETASPTLFAVTGPSRWRLENAKSGEVIEGFLKVTRRPSSHQIFPVDTISSLCFRYGVSQDELRTANPGLDLERIRPGDSLRLPPVTSDPLP